MKQLLGTVIILILASLAMAQAEPVSAHAEHHQQYGDVVPQLPPWDARQQPMDLVERDRDPSHVVFGYHPYWNGTAYQNYPWEIISHLAWFSLDMNSSGNITNAHSWPWNDLVNVAHANGVKVIVTVTLFDNDGIATLLSSATNRQNAINNLISRVNAGNADGVNIDFESVPSGQEANFNTFINDLTTAFHDQIPNSEVSIAMPAVDWWDSYDYDYLADHCDGLMIMGYNYYWSGSSSAGPVAPLYNNLASYNIGRTVSD
jgi:GH18 family chitinase